MTPRAPFFFFLLIVVQVADCNAAGPVVTIGGVDVSGGSHEATVGQSLTLSCNTTTAVWKKGSDTITNTDTSSRVFVMSGSTETMLRFTPFRTSDGVTYTCEVNSTFRTSVTINAKLPKIQSVAVTPGYVDTSPDANPSLEVTWSAVDDPAVSYVVRYSQSEGTVTAPPDGASEMNANGNSVTLSYNLAPNKRNPYTNYIWVAATSGGVPKGEYSDRASGVTLHSPTPSGVTASPNGCQSLRVTWTHRAPTSPLSLIHYRLRYRAQGGSQQTVTTTSQGSYTLNGLARATTYTVIVDAQTQLGYGFYCCVPTATTYNVGAPRMVSLAPLSTRGAVRVTWSPPTDLCGLTSPQYTIQYGRTKSTPTALPSTPSSSPFDITDLEVGQEYFVRLAVRTQSGSGTFSLWESVTTNEVPKSVSGVMLSLTFANGGPAINVTWDAPVDDDVVIAHYEVMYEVSAHPSAGGTSTSTATTHLITGLEKGALYSVQVRAVSMEGGHAGAYSAVQSITAPVDVAAPSIMRVTGENFISLEWSPPSEGSPLSYTVTWTGSGVNSSHVLPPTARNYTIRELDSNTAYSGTVEVYSLANTATVSWDAHTLPQAPTDLSLVILSGASLEVKWEPAPDANLNLTYTVMADSLSMETKHAISTPGDSSVTLSSLQELTEYNVSVQAVNSGGPSRSLTAAVRMVAVAQANTSSITGLSFEWADGDFTSLLVRWDPVTAPPGGGVTYRIRYSPVLANDTDMEAVVTNETEGTSILLTGLDPTLFYSVTVEATIQDPVRTPANTAAVGASLGVIGGLIGVIVAIVVFCLLLMWCRRKAGKVNIEYRSSRYEAKKSASNSLKDDRDSSPSGMVKENPVTTIGLQSISENVYANVDVKAQKSTTVSKTMFATHVNEMHCNRGEGFEREFEDVVNDPKASDAIAKSVSTSKNRYLNTHTFDHSRVILKVPDETGCDYINASYINGYMQESAYIASQGPTPTTISDFWQMIWDHKPAVIVMLTRVQENGKKKCEQYWHDQVDKPFDAERDFTVVTTAYRGFADYDVRDMTVQCSTDRPHKLTHFQYTAWPDHGVPLHPSSLVKFVQEVRKVHGNSQTPMVVHCSAGVGRTGTFITLDAMMERLKEKDDLDIFEFVNEMRTRRMYMVQTVEQYVLIHDALNDYITCGDTSVVAYQLRMAIHDLDKEEDGQSGFERQFEFLAKASRMPVREDEIFAKKSLVAKKNRYKDKCPYSTNYLHIAGQSASNAADYINATMMASYSKRRGYVAAQAPLESTRTDVWELIWQLKSTNIVLLCPLKEGKTLSCCKFWPDESVRSLKYGHLTISHIDTTPRPDWEMTTMQVVHNSKSSESSFEVSLFHFLSWPREGRPPIDSMLKMMGQVEKKQKDIKAPLMVMCDDGMSRSGVFITCMTEIERVKVEGGVDIFQTVKAARAQRPHMVYDSDQYKLCFEILQSHLDSFDTYANFKAV